MITLEFVETENVLKIRTEGKISLEEAIEMVREIGENKDLPRKLHMLEFALNADWLVGQQGLPELMKELKVQSNKFEQIRHAVLHLDPVHKALTNLVNKELVEGNYVRRILPNEKIARLWLFEDQN